MSSGLLHVLYMHPLSDNIKIEFYNKNNEYLDIENQIFSALKGFYTYDDDPNFYYRYKSSLFIKVYKIKLTLNNFSIILNFTFKRHTEESKNNKLLNKNFYLSSVYGSDPTFESSEIIDILMDNGISISDLLAIIGIMKEVIIVRF